MEVARQFALGLPAIDVRRDLACDEPPDALRQRFVGFIVKGRARAPVVESCHRAMLRGADANVKLGRAEGAMIISRKGAKKGDRKSLGSGKSWQEWLVLGWRRTIK